MSMNIINVFLIPEIMVPSIIVAIVLFFISAMAIKRENYDLFIAPGIRNSNYHLTNGQESGAFWDMDKASENIDDANSIASWYVDIINANKKKLGITDLAFIEREEGPVGAIALKGIITERTGLNSFIVRPRKRVLASAVKYGSRLNNSNVFIVNDVVTSGNSVMKAVELIEKYDAKVKSVVAMVNRGDVSATNFFTEKGIGFTFNDTLDK